MRRMVTTKQVEKLEEFKNIKADEWSLTTLGRLSDNTAGFVGVDEQNCLTIGSIDESPFIDWVTNGIVFEDSHNAITMGVARDTEYPATIKFNRDSDSNPRIVPLTYNDEQCLGLFNNEGDSGVFMTHAQTCCFSGQNEDEGSYDRGGSSSCKGVEST